MSLLGELVVKIVGDTQQFVSDVNKAGRQMSKFDKDMAKIANNMVKTGKLLTLAVTLPILGIGIAAIKSAADLELQQAAFETMLGSAEKARDLLDDLTELAAKTPFQLPDLAEGTKTLLAFGIELDDVLPTLSMLGDISLGDSARMKQLALVFGQITSAGRLMGQDLLQLINVGFNPLQKISEMTGESMADLKDRMSAGAISAEEVTAAFKAATSEGGLFFGGMERASLTLAGTISTLKDNVGILARSFADLLLPAIKGIVTWTTGLVQRWNEMDDSTRRMILQYAGIAAAIGPLLIIGGKAILLFQAMKKAMLTLNIVMAANPVIAITAAIALLVAGIALALPAIVNMRRRHKEYQDQLYNTAQAVATLTEEEQRGVLARISQELIEAGMEKNRLERQRAMAQALIDNATDLQKAHGATTQWQKGIDILDESLAENEEKIAASRKAIEELHAILTANVIPAIVDTTDGVEDLGDALDDDTDGLTAAVERNAEAWLNWEEDTTGAYVRVYQVLADLREGRKNADAEALEEQYQAYAAQIQARLDLTTATVAYEQQLTEEQYQAYAEQIQARIDLMTATAEYEKQLAEDVANATSLIINDVSIKFEEAIEDTRSNFEKFADWYKDNYVDTIIDATQRMVDAIVSIGTARYDAEIAAIEATTSRYEEGTDEPIAFEEEKDAKIRAIKRDQARREKALGIFNAVIDTAQAVIGMLANPGGIPGIVLSVLAGITGAAQIAAIATQPLPALAEGGIVTGPTPAMVGEGGQPEIIFPLDQLQDFMASRGDFSGGGGNISVAIDLDGGQILKYVGKASRDGRLLINQRAVVA